VTATHIVPRKRCSLTFGGVNPADPISRPLRIGLPSAKDRHHHKFQAQCSRKYRLGNKKLKAQQLLGNNNMIYAHTHARKGYYRWNIEAQKPT
jgi:hypothetical protein